MFCLETEGIIVCKYLEYSKISSYREINLEARYVCEIPLVVTKSKMTTFSKNVKVNDT